MVALKDCPEKKHVSQVLEEHLGDRYWRLNNLYWIMDDEGNKIKFHMNPVQYVLYTSLWWLNIVLKSRQHGVTTFVCIMFLDACLFNSNVRAGIVCHKLEDAKRIFRDKIKYAYRHLPVDIKAERPVLKDDACELQLGNNSSLYVGVSMRSGTLQYLHVSEYGWLSSHAAPKAKEIKSGAMETVHENGVIVIESTAEGIGDDFHLMCQEAHKKKLEHTELTRLDYKFHFFPWYKKDENVLTDEVAISAEMEDYFRRIERITGDTISLPHRRWYVKKKETLRRLIFKEHPSTPEEAFQTAIEGAYFAHEMIAAKEQGRIGNYRWDKRAQVFTFWDVGSIHTAIWWWQFVRDEIRVIDMTYDNTGQGLSHHIQMVKNKPYVYGEHWTGWDMDPDEGSNRKNPVTGKIIKDEASGLGINFRILPKCGFNDRIEAGRLALDKCYFNEATTEVGISALFNFRQAVNKAMTTDEKVVYAKDPAPGPECHIADAFTHGALAYIQHIYVGGVPVGSTAARLPAGHGTEPYDQNTLLRGMRAGRRNRRV